VIVSIVYIDMR